VRQPQHSWYPVADSTELPGSDRVLRVELGETAWALARLGGSIVAFEDRCPHRLAPLSAGWVEDGHLRCGYHGWVFDSAGACSLIPANGPDRPIPSRACLRPASAVAERDGRIWLRVPRATGPPR
jgi:vanillate O-demethylase monooxygenase subunit